MDNWALVVADTLLLAVALAGGVATLLRARGLGGRATGFAVAGCGVLLAAAAFDVIWWTTVFPATGSSNVAVLTTGALIATGMALMIVSAHSGRAAAAAGGRAPYRHAAPSGNHAAPGHPGSHQPAPAGGWTPPQQAEPADWRHMSGVWSIPRGAFDQPPPGPPRP